MAVLGPCLATILALSNVLGPNAPRVDEGGTIYSLLDAGNRRIGETPDPSQGRNDGVASFDTNGYPTVKLRNYQRSIEESATVPSCDANGVPLQETEFKITMYRQQSLAVTWKEMQALCGDAAKVYNSGARSAENANAGAAYSVRNTPLMNDTVQKLMSKIYKLVADINKDITTKIATKAGVNRRTGTNAAKTYNVFRADGTKNEMGYNELVTDYEYNGWGGIPVMLGGASSSMFARSMRWGNFAATGTDYSKVTQQDPFRFYLSKIADTTFGADRFLTMAPGAAKLVTYNRYGTSGQFSGDWGTSSYGQFTIPEFGDDIRFDLQVDKANCPGPSAIIIVSLYFDIYVNENIFNAADPAAGVNGLFMGKIGYLAA
jgi:hypothetical protein